MAIEFAKAGLKFKKQYFMPVNYNGCVIKDAYKLDFWVEDKVVVELKAVDKMTPPFDAQIITYMKLSKSPLGLLINFNEKLVKDGIKRFALTEFNS